MTEAASSYRQKYAISLIRDLLLNREQRYYLSWYVTRGTFAKITYQEEIDSVEEARTCAQRYHNSSHG